MGITKKASDEKCIAESVRELKSSVEKEIYGIIGRVYQETGITIAGITVHHQKPIFGNSIEARAFQVEVTLEF